MDLLKKKNWLLYLLLNVSLFVHAQSVKVVTNHVGYEDDKTKHAIIVTDHKLNLTTFSLIDVKTGKTVYTSKPVFSGPVDKWKNWQFWTIDFSPFTTDGT